MIPDLASAERTIRRGMIVTAIGIAGLAALYVLALQYTPPDRLQRFAQKILYVHAPSAWAALMAFALVGVASVLYLWLSDDRLDRFAEASAEVGMVFAAIMLTTGPIWGKPIWGAWWVWNEPRLTFTLIEFLLFAGYFALRASIRDPRERARYSAVVGIMGMLLVPFIHLTVYLFETQHPKPVFLKPEAPSMPWIMVQTLLVAIAVFTVLYIGFVMTRYGIGTRRAVQEARDA